MTSIVNVTYDFLSWVPSHMTGGSSDSKKLTDLQPGKQELKTVRGSKHRTCGSDSDLYISCYNSQALNRIQNNSRDPSSCPNPI